MSRLRSGILASMALLILQASAGSSADPTMPGVQAVGRLGGIWFGQAWVKDGYISRTLVQVPARGLMAADGNAYFLIRNTVLNAQLRPSPGSQYAMLHGAPLVGTAPDLGTFSLRSYLIFGATQAQALNLSWCNASSADPDICPGGWNRLDLNYNGSYYGSGSSLAKIAGHYVDTLGQYKGVLTIAGDGYVFMQDPATGCVVNGRVTMINPAYSVYSIKLAYANCRSPTLKSATFTGLMSYNGSAKQIFALMLGTAGGASAANRLAFRRQ